MKPRLPQPRSRPDAPAVGGVAEQRAGAGDRWRDEKAGPVRIDCDTDPFTRVAVPDREPPIGPGFEFVDVAGRAALAAP